MRRSTNTQLISKKQKWKGNNIKKLKTFTNNPKQFWQHLKTLRGNLRTSSVDAIRPRQWKVWGDNPDNFKGIAIISCLSKLFNLLLTSRLTCFVNEKSIFKYNQIGFQES